MEKKIRDIKLALKNRNFAKFGQILEAEAINMHTVMMTSTPPLYYWLPETLNIMNKVAEWRSGGLESYFTTDAGPNVHVICRAKDVGKLKVKLTKLEGVRKILVNTPAQGARIVEVV